MLKDFLSNICNMSTFSIDFLLYVHNCINTNHQKRIQIKYWFILKTQDIYWYIYEVLDLHA